MKPVPFSNDINTQNQLSCKELDRLITKCINTTNDLILKNFRYSFPLGGRYYIKNILEEMRDTHLVIREQFEKYKTYFPGQVDEDNPYGFGYKIEDRVQLEYMIVKLDDIEKIIEEPTQQEMQ